MNPAGGEARLAGTLRFAANADDEPLKSEEKEGIFFSVPNSFGLSFLLGRLRIWSTLISIKDQNLYMRISPLKTDFLGWWVIHLFSCSQQRKEKEIKTRDSERKTKLNKEKN